MEKKNVQGKSLWEWETDFLQFAIQKYGKSWSLRQEGQISDPWRGSLQEAVMDDLSGFLIPSQLYVFFSFLVFPK